jgi:hypothetical protein
MLNTTNCPNQTADLPSFTFPDANELERLEGGDKCVIYVNPTTGKGGGLCSSDTNPGLGGLYWITVSPTK